MKMMEEEREEEEEADTTKKESDVSRSTSSSGTGAKGPDSGSTSKIKESKDHYVGSRLVEGEIRPGDTATAEILADAIDEAVGAGKLGQDKLTVAELQLLDDISRGSVVSFVCKCVLIKTCVDLMICRLGEKKKCLL